MRKYYQAALAVTAVISLVSLLVYRHEYNKLRYVLEVFNYFGKPRKLENCTNFYPTTTAFNAKFDEPIPSWQRLEDDLYVYSAYSISDKEIRAVGLGTANSIANVQCLVFFENESKPILGSFRFIPIYSAITSGGGRAGSLRYGGYHFVCKYTSDETPTGITFVTKSNKYLNYAPIFPVKEQPRHSSSNNRIGMCVMQPSMKPMRSLDMIGFISFHALIGMDNFIVYDSGIPSAFNVRLKEMASDLTSLWKLTYTVVPWNFPFTEIDPNVIRDIVEVDCLYRTYNNVAYAVVLSWNEYVVLKYHHALMDLMTDFKRSELAADRYKLKMAVFCTQQENNKQHVNLTLTALKKTKSVSIVEDRPLYLHKPNVALRSSHMYTREIGENLITANQYKYCDDYRDGQGTEDSTILRFAHDVQNSSILRKYLGLYDTSDIDVK